MNEKKIRTVVCGSTFGQFYMEALKSMPSQFEVVGLLANGSIRSRQCADFYGVPLFKNVEELDRLPEKIDLACVVLRSGVLGGKGTDISLAFIERGIHVLQEHPVHQNDMAMCLRSAKQKKIIFMIGNMYIYLPAFKRFAACAGALFKQQKALYLDIALATQVSFPMIHMLLNILPEIRPFKINHVIKDSGPFQLVTGKWGNLPMTIRVHNEINPNDPDNYLHLLHSFSIGFAGGSLSLTDTHGPVVWRPQLHIPRQGVLGKLSGQFHLNPRSTVILGPAAPPPYRDILVKQWPGAIVKDLEMVKAIIEKKINAEKRTQQELVCAQHWHTLTNTLGYPVLRFDSLTESVDIKMLEELASQIPAEPEEIFLDKEYVHA
jgi:thiazolinyl imide reductase